MSRWHKAWAALEGAELDTFAILLKVGVYSLRCKQQQLKGRVLGDFTTCSDFQVKQHWRETLLSCFSKRG